MGVALSLNIHCGRGYPSQANALESMIFLRKSIEHRLSNGGGAKAQYPPRSRLLWPSQRIRIDDFPKEICVRSRPASQPGQSASAASKCQPASQGSIASAASQHSQPANAASKRAHQCSQQASQPASQPTQPASWPARSKAVPHYFNIRLGHFVRIILWMTSS